MWHNKCFVILLALFSLKLHAQLSNLLTSETSVVTSSIIKQVPSARGCVEGSHIKLSKNLIRENTYIIKFDILTEQETNKLEVVQLNSRYWTEKDPMVSTKVIDSRSLNKKVTYKYEEDTLDEAISRCESIISQLNRLKR
jgi:hypothetical protein